MASTSRVTPGRGDDHAPGVEAVPGLGSSLGMRKWPPITVTTTMGTLTRKIDPYQKCSSSAPPVMGPKATAMPEVAPQMPSAFCRSRGR